MCGHAPTRMLWILDFRFLAARGSSLAAGLIEMQDNPCRNRRFKRTYVYLLPHSETKTTSSDAKFPRLVDELQTWLPRHFRLHRS